MDSSCFLYFRVCVVYVVWYHVHGGDKQNAINGMHGMAVDGKRLRVEIKKPKPGQPY